MIPDEVMLALTPWLCGGMFIFFVGWAIFALMTGMAEDLKLRGAKLEEARQNEIRAREDAHPSWVERKREYLRKSGVPVEYIEDPRVVTVDGNICDEWPTRGGGVILSAWKAQDQDPRWKEPEYE